MNKQNFQFFSLLVLTCMLLVSCSRKKIDWDDTKSVAVTFHTNHARKIYESIDIMGTEVWKKETYISLKEKIHFYTTKGKVVEVDKEKLLKYLDKIYCNILIRDASEIIDHKSCETKHSLLKLLKAEIDIMYKIVNDQNLSAVKKRIELHNSIIYYSIPNISPNSVDSKYDFSYIDNVFRQKADFEKANFPCEGIKRKLNTIPSELNRRHVNFLNALVELYVAENKFNSNIDNIITTEVDKYYYNNEGASIRYYGVNSKNAADSRKIWKGELDHIKNKY